ncbi:hypothetical protein M902_0605 [Bacteriovorax sp. BAL6_X]|uniref:hypothetical protein n=1 Tax=Bacteriovorax sp. BAL6_X TaxID=1201290 RepID=UPI0003869EAF|nr:hypothetical protein [Bacteriovorax sp. BAL6_X]EPZ50150.1 hypothetical protein M902_0605 [Bacteriovorax sp. BAL6_X]
MRSYLILTVLLFSNCIFSKELERLTPSQSYILTKNFNKKSMPIIKALGSGDIVGNGSGLIEQNFTFAYYNLQNAIFNCLGDKYKCQVDSQEESILREINQAFIAKADMKRPLIFVSKEFAGDFFHNKIDITSRIAKTGFSRRAHIFINLEESIFIANDIPAMISILIHELGHQIGVISHSFLDQLGTKVRNQWNENWQSFEFEINGAPLTLRLLSNANNYISSNLSYTYNGKLEYLGETIYKYLSCGDKEFVYGFNLNNGHWQRPIYSDNEAIIRMNFWLDTYCEGQDKMIRVKQNDLSIEFIHKDGKIQAEIINFRKVQSPHH